MSSISTPKPSDLLEDTTDLDLFASLEEDEEVELEYDTLEYDTLEDEEDSENDNCPECQHQRHVALIDSMPQPVVKGR